MKRIDTATRALNLFGAGKDGWRNSNLGLGIPATDFNADWTNGVQEEICSLIEAAGLVLSGADFTQLRQAMLKLAVGRLLNIQVFNSSGTYTPTPGMTKFRLRAVGGGGAGGSGFANTASQISVGSGGAYASFAEALYAAAAAGAGLAVTIGAAGAPAGGGGTGGNGGTTSVGSIMVCPGGQGGLAVQSSTSTTFSLAGQGVPGAVASISGHLTGFVSTGQPGICGQTFGGNAVSGQGGGGPFGAGAGNTNSGPGNSPGGKGGGGSGAVSIPGGGVQLGGAGAGGMVVIEEFA